MLAAREELSRLQTQLRNYARVLADLSAVEDLTDWEDLVIRLPGKAALSSRRTQRYLSLGSTAP